MADQPSNTLFDAYQKAAQQFDYAVTGATGALCTYILQTFKPQRVDLSPYTVELCALLVLIGSVVLGFKLLESKVTLVKINTALLHLNDGRVMLAGALPQLAAVSVQAGESAAREVSESGEKILALASALEHRNDVCSRLYVWRNRCLGLGFVLLVFARLSTPYWRH